MQDAPKAAWSIPYISMAFFPSLKQNFIAHHSSKVSSHPDSIFEIHQLWQSGFSRMYSNSCCGCSFEPEIIKIGHSSHSMCYIVIYSIITTRRKTSLPIYVPLTLFVRVERVVWGFTVRGSWRPNRNFNILTSTLMAGNVVSFSFSRAAQPEAQRPTLLSDGFLYCILSASSLDPNSIGGPKPLWPGVAFLTTSCLLLRSISNCNLSGAPRAPSAWCGFPYHISSITPSDL